MVPNVAELGLIAAEYLLLPVELTADCVERVQTGLPIIQEARAFNPDLKVLGALALASMPRAGQPMGLTAKERLILSEYHREVTRQASVMPESVEKLLPRLRDPDYTQVLIVTLPEATQVHEAAKLQGDLNRAGIAPCAWVINQSLTPLTVTDVLLRSRQIREAAYIRKVVDQHAVRTFVIPWQIDPPVGAAGLRSLVAARPDRTEGKGTPRDLLALKGESR